MKKKGSLEKKKVLKGLKGLKGSAGKPANIFFSNILKGFIGNWQWKIYDGRWPGYYK